MDKPLKSTFRVSLIYKWKRKSRRKPPKNDKEAANVHSTRLEREGHSGSWILHSGPLILGWVSYYRTFWRKRNKLTSTNFNTVNLLLSFVWWAESNLWRISSPQWMECFCEGCESWQCDSGITLRIIQYSAHKQKNKKNSTWACSQPVCWIDWGMWSSPDFMIIQRTLANFFFFILRTTFKCAVLDQL